ncbi:FATC domain containing protein [Tritrichomonas foetus]|uniref:FATC domain containing protein n=1 Tax=Tritrichomonas foetus TaxID=1144522 RepID=A0A1J4JQR8_9EUKA|nr:FATC domain containing protein [Tritrichomonas foetus]|eukprot:OHT01465.1 FATC domain containing protein [Tritrichomonas foetus]
METLVKQVIASAVPSHESLKSSDFFGSVNILQGKIIDIFRYSSLQFVPPFLNGMLSTIQTNSYSQDKRTRFSTAICVTALIHLFPFDDYVIHYRPIIEKLLVPGYRPIIEIGALVVRRLDRISGPNRNNFLMDLIVNNRVFTTRSSNEVKYTAAIIWRELASSYPQGFFALKEPIFEELSLGIQNSEKSTSMILVETVKELFDSEAASVGPMFLENLHDFFTRITTHIFSETQKFEDLKILFELLHVLLKHRPYISIELSQEYILPQCYHAFQCPDYSVVFLALHTIIELHKTKAMKISKKLIDSIIKLLLQLSIRDPNTTGPIFYKIIYHFTSPNNSEKLLEVINSLFNKLPTNVGPLYAFNLTTAVIESGNTQIVSSFLQNVSKFMIKSPLPIPINKILKVLNYSYPNWVQDYLFFKNQMIHVIRQELSNPSIRTDRLVISLKAIQQIPNISFIDALELNCLVLKYTTSKDLELREQIVATTVHLFKDYPDQIPLNTIIDLVKFALDDRVISVRKKSLRAFTEVTYQYIEQPDVFDEFYKFNFDESPIIQKESLAIIRHLHTYDYSAIRQLLLSSINLMNSNFDIIVPETTPVWIVFPHLLITASPIIHIYADSIFQIFHKMLKKRFQKSQLKESTLIFMNSAILKDIDESLIKSVTRLYLLCPEIVPIKPILEIFCSVLVQPVHPWTKENILKSLKNLASVVSVTNECPEIVDAILTIIRKKESMKLVTKSLKVMGTIGVCDISISPPKEPLILRSSLQNILYLKQFFLRIYFKFLNDLFDSVNIDSTREVIAATIAKLYSIEPSCIQQHIEPFMTRYLNFVKNSSTEKMPTFLHYLKEMIFSSGHLIIPYTDRIFQAIEEHWHDKYTKESSEVFSVLVMTTDGRCETILHLLVSVSFLLMRSKKELQSSAQQIFHLLRVIAQFCPNYLQSIIDGAVTIMSTPGSPAYLQQQSLDTIDFIIKNSNAGQHLSMITRCLNNVAMRSQMIWREQAIKLLAQVELVPREPLARKIKKKKVEKIEQPQINIEEILKYISPPRKADRGQKNILNWFEELRKYLLTISPSEVMRTMLDLPTMPVFAFRFAFYSIWPTLHSKDKDVITKKLDKIFLTFDMINSPFVLSQFVGLIEFAVLSEVNMGVNFDAVIKACISSSFYEKALFFLENYPCDGKIHDHMEKLIKMNIALSRNIEARSLAGMYRSNVKASVWMALSEWETALELIANSPDPNKFLSQKVECLAAMENWKEIKDMKKILLEQPRNVQAKLARFMWMAELFQGTKEAALNCVNLTGGYTVNDCVQKAILYVHLGMLEEANDSVHLGWRYLATSVCNIGKHNKKEMIMHIFQAEQLHELAEVIDIKTDPIAAKGQRTTWMARLQFIKDDPDKQEELFKIRSLVPDHVDLTEFAYSILSSTRRTKKAIPRLIDLFFPDKNSDNAKYCRLKLLNDRNKRVKKAKKLMRNCSPEVENRLNNFLGKEIFDVASSVGDLKNALDFLLKGRKNSDAIAQSQVLLSLIQNDENLAIIAVDYLKKCMEINMTMALYQLESLTIHFSKSKLVAEAVLSVFQNVPYACFRGIEGSCVLSLSHSSKYVVKTAKDVCSALSIHMPHSIIFDLLTNAEKHPKLTVYNDLLNIIQSNNSLFYSQMIRVITKLKLISYTLFDKLIDQLKECFEAMCAKKYDKAYEILKSINSMIKITYISRYDNEFLERMKANWGQFLTKTLSKGRLLEEDLPGIQKMIIHIIKKQDAIRVIPLSSLDTELDTKTNWSIPIVGKDDKNDLKLVKFFHSVQRLDNGLRVSVIGSNGKKYNFHLLRETQAHEVQSEQFMNLLFALTPLSLSQRTLVEISPKLTLIELLKGHIQMYDLISMYMASKGRQIEEEFNNIETCFLTFSHAKLVRKIEHLTKDTDTENLRKALLITSKNASMYINKTTMFAKTMGTLAAVSYLIGSADNTPKGILIDKTTGEVTFTNFCVSGSSQPVPFRLTRMIVSAFGPYGVNGPYKDSLEKALKGVRKYSHAIASCSQLAIGNAPFDPAILPIQYTKRFINKGNNEEDSQKMSEIDQFYSRFDGYGKDLKTEIEILIEKASSIENLSNMPAQFYAWW